MTSSPSVALDGLHYSDDSYPRTPSSSTPLLFTSLPIHCTALHCAPLHSSPEHPPQILASNSPKNMHRHAIHNITPRTRTRVPRLPPPPPPHVVLLAHLPGPGPQADAIALAQRLDEVGRGVGAEVAVRGREVAAFGAVVAPGADGFAVVGRVVFCDAGGGGGGGGEGRKGIRKGRRRGWGK